MKYHYCLMTINFILMLSSAAVGIYKIRSASTALRIFTYFLVSSLVFESIAYWAAIKLHNNIAVYAINSIVEASLICLYFNYSIEFFPKRYIGIILCVISIAVGIWSLFYNKKLGGHHVFFTLYEAFLIIVLAMISISQNLYKTTRLNDEQKQHFRISIVLIFFWTVAFLSWGLYDVFSVKYPNEKWIVDLSLFILNVVANFFFFMIYISYPKKQKKI